MTINTDNLIKKYNKDNLKDLVMVMFPNEEPLDRVLTSVSKKFNSGELNMIRIMEIKRREEWYTTSIKYLEQTGLTMSFLMNWSK